MAKKADKEEQVQTIDVTQVLLDLEGKEILTGPTVCFECEETVEAVKPLTVRMAINRALLTPIEADKNIKPDEHVERRLLAQHVYENGEVSFTSEYITMIKKRVSAVFLNSLIPGSICLMLDPAMKNKFKF